MTKRKKITAHFIGEPLNAMNKLQPSQIGEENHPTQIKRAKLVGKNNNKINEASTLVLG